MPDHSWMRDVLIDMAMYAEKHGMSDVYTHVALTIEAVLPFVAATALQSTGTNDVVIELSSRRINPTKSVGGEQVWANRNGRILPIGEPS